MLYWLFRRAAANVLAVALVGLSACEQLPSEATEEYRLVAVNGSALPVSIVTGRGESAQVFDGNLRLQSNGKYLQDVHYSVTDGASNPMDTGTFRREGSTIHFTSADRGTYVGTVSQDEITLSFDLGDADPSPEQLTFIRK